MPSVDYFQLLNDLRRHAVACKGECDAFHGQLAVLNKLPPQSRKHEMSLWRARVDCWEALFSAYGDAATELAKAGNDGVQRYLAAILRWLSAFRPDPDDCA